MNKPFAEAKVYSSSNRLTVVAPMPGLQAGDIEVSLAGELLTIQAAGQARFIRVALPRPVDGHAAVASYSYGVLVVAIPLAEPGAPELDELGPGLVKQNHQAPVVSE